MRNAEKREDGKGEKKEVGKMRGWGEKAGVGDGEIPEGGSGTRRRPKRTGLWRGYRCGLRPVGAIGAYAPEGRWKRRKLGRWEDERVGKKAGLREGEVWKELKR